ncbi:MAG: hypothetical protein ABMB14_05980 [Myxococcota bacterium]
MVIALAPFLSVAPSVAFAAEAGEPPPGAIVSPGAPAPGSPAVPGSPGSEVFGWDWSRTHRFYLESQVQLPLVMWLATPFNHQARTTGFDLRIVTTCADAQVETRRTVQVDCRLDDVALSAAGLVQEEGLLQPILTELDEALTGSVVQLQMHADGRIANIDLEGGLDRRNNRVGQINENLRLVVSRAFAGLDLGLPESSDDAAWVQYQSWLMRTPSADGSSGGSQIVHRVTARDGAFATIDSGGRGIIVPGEGENKYDTRFTSHTAFDLRTGRISDRTWTIIGGPTSSSSIAFGAAGYPYIQQGRVVALTGDRTWDVGPSEELPAGSVVQTAIQAGPVLGTELSN